MANTQSEAEIEQYFANHEFVVPTTKVKVPTDMEQWLKSSAHNDYLGFILTINEAVKGKKLSDECKVSDFTTSVMNLLDVISAWIDNIKPIEQPQRFGNKAFRTWHQKLKENAAQMIENIFPNNLKRAAPEVCF